MIRGHATSGGDDLRHSRSRPRVRPDRHPRLAATDAESSSWRCRNVECTGDLAEELHRASDGKSILTGAEMLRLAGGVVQIVDGDFEAYRPGETEPRLFVRAIDSSEYAVITDDERLLARVRQRFRDVRDSPDDSAYSA